MIKIFFTIILVLSGVATQFLSAQTHPIIFATGQDRSSILEKIKHQQWASLSFNKIKATVDPYVNRHQADPKWIISKMSMYWKDGEHFTQCYLENLQWARGEGNAPVPTVRMPGMRVWNEYVNVPLADRISYNESGDMRAIRKTPSGDQIDLVPYKKSGHLIRQNNNEILTLAEKSAFIYWLSGDSRYAKFSADIFSTWLLGTYYMNPILDPGKSSGGPGGYAPGGTLGYYDYEQIHDDLQTHGAIIYDFLYDYLRDNEPKIIHVTGKSLREIAATVFRRFIDIGMVRGGKSGNWNINGWEMMMPSILVLDTDLSYADGHGRDYYLKYFTTTSTPYHNALPDILKDYDPVTGLWAESPGYALGTINSVLNMSLMIYKTGVNTIGENPMIQKAAMAIFPWLDARGNVVVFGDMRGGPGNFNSFERLLTYYYWRNDSLNASKVASALIKGISQGHYNRNATDIKGLCLNVPEIPESKDKIDYDRIAYSAAHRHLVLKNGDDIATGLMATLYGGFNKKQHLSPNGLAAQFYNDGWAMAPDASGYESYWTADYNYHQTATGSNTIIPGYSFGEIKINASEPYIDSLSFTNSKTVSDMVCFADVSAAEKRRVIALVRTSAKTGYYVDIFRSNQNSNDYLYHNLGDFFQIKDSLDFPLRLNAKPLNRVGEPGFAFFKNSKSAYYNGDFTACFKALSSEPTLSMDMHMKGEDGREIFATEAPYTTIIGAVTPNKINAAPGTTPMLLIRQNDKDGWQSPFVGVFEPYSKDPSIVKVSFPDSPPGMEIIKVDQLHASQYIIHSVDNLKKKTLSGNIDFQGCFGLVSLLDGHLDYLFLAKGKSLSFEGIEINAAEDISVCLTKTGKFLTYSSTGPFKLKIPTDRGFRTRIIQTVKVTQEEKEIQVPLIRSADRKSMSLTLPMGHKLMFRMM
ncbi:hypothetical protein [Pedobacter frigidisoli]|uniref:hypothetical protein n=1 Tax=Pedobacter frigidisoli TaxID=2530455 RepID=UPI00292EBB57|nr:hypothetical protein [Pedobacter frigidisoli]